MTCCSLSNTTSARSNALLIASIRAEKGEEINARLSNIVMSGLEQAHDRIEHGDYNYDRDGNEIGRKRMSGRDLGTLTGIMYDKLRVHNNQPTSINAGSGKLEQLAEQMMRLTQEKVIKHDDITDIEMEPLKEQE